MSKNTTKTSKKATKTVEIACPHQRRVVKGLYPCDANGRYIMMPDGSFNLALIECSQDDGRCAETLCALHRFNRRGLGTWYPDTLMGVRENKQNREHRPARSAMERNDGGKKSFDQLC